MPKRKKKKLRKKITKKTSGKPAKRGVVSKKDLKLYKKLLVKEKMDIFRGLTGITNETLRKSQRDASGDLSGYSYHMADMASDLYERDFLLQLASSERELLLRIDEALRRIQDGEYGACQDCGKKITKARLKAVPYAPLCRNCQEKEEKKK